MTDRGNIFAYGSWPSPVSAEYVTAGSVARDFPCQAGENIYWQETRPDEEGRTVIVVRFSSGDPRDLLPFPISCQCKVHEYGGRAWLVAGDTLYYVDKSDQRIYRTPIPAAGDNSNFDALAISPPGVDLRFADFCLDEERGRIIAVCEDHSEEGIEPRNYLISVPLDGGAEPRPLMEGADFYASPRLSPDGSKLAWLSWDHPLMPWDGAVLQCGALDDTGDLDSVERIAGGEAESIFQPEWSPRGDLHFVSDATGWWNLYRHVGVDNEPLYPADAEFGLPLWSLGMTTYDFLADGRIGVLYTRNGHWYAGILDTSSGDLRSLETPYSHLSALRAVGNNLLFIGSSPVTASEVATVEVSRARVSRLAGGPPGLDGGYISCPHFVTFPTGDGDQAHGLYYPPTNRDCLGPDEELPPLIVVCHGGPTGASHAVLNFKIQYWTSRGFALLDVNYRGSTGFGRAYRKKLERGWGVVDVEDAVAGASYLVAGKLADPRKLIIRGSSAGGYTVLAALTFSDAFTAGASLYGVGDLEALARDTHKFEARYLDTLVGPYPGERETYRQRSPIHHAGDLNCPVIFFQGLEDRVVPPAQSEAMVAALRTKGIPVSYITFDDEGHGFRKAANIKRALVAELAFYRKVLSIPAQESMADVDIANFPDGARPLR